MQDQKHMPFLPVLMICQGRQTATVRTAPRGFHPIELRVPEYPEIARRNNWEGSGIVEIHLDADGRVFDVIPDPKSGHDVFEVAIISVLRPVLFPRSWPDHFRLPYVFTLKPCAALPRIKH